MMNILEVDEQEFCRPMFSKCVGMHEDCVLRMQGYGLVWQ